MSTRQILFAGWCLLIFGGNTIASYYAWSPFADGKRGSSSGLYGPRHK